MEAFVRSGKLSPEQGQALIASAASIVYQVCGEVSESVAASRLPGLAQTDPNGVEAVAAPRPGFDIFLPFVN